jgi:hypothetical protein
MMLRIHTSLAAVALLFLPAGARSAPPPDLRPVRATLALVPSLPDASARALLIVRAGSGGAVILLRQADASVADLAAAVTLLDRTREREPVPLVRDRHVVVRAVTATRLGDRLETRLANQLRRLRRAPPRDVDGVGVVPAIEVRLPSTPR